jgi:mono/diheme cytochrome c family protein
MTYDYGHWWLVAIHIVWVSVFALTFLRPGRRREWRWLAALAAFVVALYIEMYGFPLTIYMLTALLGRLPAGFIPALPLPMAAPAGERPAEEKGHGQRWVAAQGAAAPEPREGLAAEGKEIYTQNACVGCHTIAGVSQGSSVPTAPTSAAATPSPAPRSRRRPRT